MNRLVVAAITGAAFFWGISGAQDSFDFNDYPTEARADYVFACMAVNGQTRENLRRCSCSIDVIASILPYKKYEEAETVLSLARTGGERMSLFKTSAMARSLVADLRRAQAEGEFLCF